MFLVSLPLAFVQDVVLFVHKLTVAVAARLDQLPVVERVELQVVESADALEFAVLKFALVNEVW